MQVPSNAKFREIKIGLRYREALIVGLIMKCLGEASLGGGCKVSRRRRGGGECWSP